MIPVILVMVSTCAALLISLSLCDWEIRLRYKGDFAKKLSEARLRIIGLLRDSKGDWEFRLRDTSRVRKDKRLKRTRKDG